MRIVLEKYTIGSDANCWTLYDRRKKASGEEYEVPRAYFPSLASLLQSLPDKELRVTPGDANVSDVLKRLDEVMGELREIGSKIEKEWPKDGPRLTTVSEEEPNVYPLPGRILNLFPDLQVIRSANRGRGTTVYVRIEDEDKPALIESLRKQQDEHPLIVNRALAILGAV